MFGIYISLVKPVLQLINHAFQLKSHYVLKWNWQKALLYWTWIHSIWHRAIDFAVLVSETVHLFNRSFKSGVLGRDFNKFWKLYNSYNSIFALCLVLLAAFCFALGEFHFVSAFEVKVKRAQCRSSYLKSYPRLRKIASCMLANIAYCFFDKQKNKGRIQYWNRWRLEFKTWLAENKTFQCDPLEDIWFSLVGSRQNN